MAYDGSSAQPPLKFPLSGPPVCVSLGHPTNPGRVRSVHDERKNANFIELSSAVHRAATPAEKFYLEPSKQHEGLLHVRCCDGNKYWAAEQQLVRHVDGRSSSAPWFIGGTADKTEEDLTKPSCTLFCVTTHDGSSFRFFHSQQRKYACVSSLSAPAENYLQLSDHVGDDSFNTNDFSVRRLSQQKQLPRYVAFKGYNGNYITESDIHTNNHRCLQLYPFDITNPGVIHETFTDEYGVVRIRHNASGRFWRFSREHGGCIVTVKDAGFDSKSGIPEDTLYKDVNTLFKVVIKDGNNIALQNLGEGKFCKVSEFEVVDNVGYWNILASSVDNNTKEATFQIEEPVRSREIYDIQYRVGGTKISSNKNVSRTEVLATNRTHETHYSQTTIEMYDRTESTWDASLSLDVGIKAHMSASLPGIMDAGADGHADFHGEYNWGEAKKTQTKRSTLYSYPVPPMTKVICSIFSREDVVDVPFSYTQKDVLFSGEVIPPREIQGGVYRGVNSTDIDIDTREEKIG